VGICGAVPSPSALGGNTDIILGDVIISSGIVQYDFGRRLPEVFARKDTLLASLGRPTAEIRAQLAKLQSLRYKRKLLASMCRHLEQLQVDEPDLDASYPGVQHDCLYEATYRHVEDGKQCDKAGCNGKLVERSRLSQGSSPAPVVHFGLVASGDAIMKSGMHRDDIADRDEIIAFEMEGAGVADTLPCIIIKGACDYADSHKAKSWQKYAAATAASCAKGFLEFWTPSLQGLCGSS
jgi:nucleoside phosphorylase